MLLALLLNGSGRPEPTLILPAQMAMQASLIWAETRDNVRLMELLIEGRYSA
jgi:hypothetical protein